MLPEQQQRIMGYFIEEAKDHLNTIEQGLLSLQATIKDPEKANEVFRAAHSVKGGAAMLGLESIQQTAHRLEDYFKILKETSVQVDKSLETMFLRISDGLKDLLEQLEGPFGLTPDKAQEIMAGVEPIFDQIEGHLNLLVEKADSSPASIEATADDLADDGLQNTFRQDVASLLRQLLTAFKQSDTADTRARIYNICSQLLTIGDRFELSAWCDLIETARLAASNPDNNYRTLAPVLIKEIKKAQDLVLIGRASEISVCDAMQSLLPEDILATDLADSESDELESISFSDSELGTELDLEEADLTSAEDSELDLDADLALESDPDSAEEDGGLEDLFSSENPESQSFSSNGLDSIFDLTPTDSSIEFAGGLFDSPETDEGFEDLFDEDSLIGDGDHTASASEADSAGTDLPGSLQSEEDQEQISQMSASLEFDEIPLELSTLNRNVNGKEKADESLDALLATMNVTGPDVGTEELNSLADLFDGDLEELDNTLGGQAFISEEMRLNPERIDLTSEDDFTDLLGGDDVADDFLQETSANNEIEEDLFGGTLTSSGFATGHELSDDDLNSDEAERDTAGSTLSSLNLMGDELDLMGDDSDEAVETSFDQRLVDEAIAPPETPPETPEETTADLTAEMADLSEEDVWAESENENDGDLFSNDGDLAELETEDFLEAAPLEEPLFIETSKEYNGKASFTPPYKPSEDPTAGSFGELLGHTPTTSPRELDIEFPTLTGAKLQAVEDDIDSFFSDVRPDKSAQPANLGERSAVETAQDEPSLLGDQLADDPWGEFSDVLSPALTHNDEPPASDGRGSTIDDFLESAASESQETAAKVPANADTQIIELWEDIDSPLPAETVSMDATEATELNLDLELDVPAEARSEAEADGGEEDIEEDIFSSETEVTDDLSAETELFEAELFEAELFEAELSETELSDLAFDLGEAVEESDTSAPEASDISPADESLDDDIDDIGALFEVDESTEELVTEESDVDFDSELLGDDLLTAEADETSADAALLFDWDSTAENDSVEDSSKDSLDDLLEMSVQEEALDTADTAVIESTDTPAAEGTDLQDLDLEDSSEGIDDDLLDLDLFSSDADQGSAEESSSENDKANLALDDLLAEEHLEESSDEVSAFGEDLDGQGLEDDFDDLDSLLSEADAESAEVEDEPTFMGDAEIAAAPAVVPAIENDQTEDEDFGDLERLLEEGTAESSAPAAPRRLLQRPAVRRGSGPREQNMRVSVSHLDNLSNLVGELVVSRNTLERDQERLRQFLDNLLFQVQQLNDVGQRMRDLYERSLLESSLMSNRRAYSSAGGRVEPAAVSHATGQTFDALEMDKFTGFHTLSQEMIELIVRVRESASDIGYTVESSDQVTRQFRQITTQLQEGLNTARMVAFSQAADRLPRAVRDISLKCGKEARLVVEGKDTLIDKMIVENLYDPLTHLVNNAITHGIETPAVRTAAGKPPEGTITVRAFYQGNQTVIYVADDGAGIDTDFIKRKAVERHLITQREAAPLSGIETYELLFRPGFSTRDQADNFAGRGVGMDVVRTSLAEIRGSITIDSELGKGTSFTIRLPLTLSISKALSCVSNQARIAFPMDGVEDMLDVPRDRILKDDQDRDCVRWRDTLLPFQPVTELLKFNRTIGRGRVYGGSQNDDVLSVIVLRSANTFVAVQVDQVIGEQEIVIKQLEGPVPKPLGIAGATVLGDGRVMPIADVLELIDIATGRIRREPASMLWGDAVVEEAPVKSDPTVLIVDDSITVRELLSMSFNKIGYRVEQARDGQEAWDKLRSGLPCDLVFCDIEMPRMDGLELLSRMQKDNHLSRIPIAMLTSRGADRHRQMAVDLGASGYFTKPYLEEALLDAAQRMLNGETLAKGRGG